MTWNDLRARKDLVGGKLDLMEHGIYLRGDIIIVEWISGCPVFHLKNTFRYEISSKNWVVVSNQVIDLERVGTADSAVKLQGPFLDMEGRIFYYISGCGRGFIVPKNARMPILPIGFYSNGGSLVKTIFCSSNAP